MTPLRRLVLARLVSEAGSAAALFVGVWGTATFSLGATPGQMALAALAWGLASIIGSVSGGVLVDRFNPRRVLIAGEVLAVPATLSLVTASSMQELVMLMIPASFAGALIMTAVASFPPFIAAGETELARTNGAVEMAFGFAFVAGPAAGAVIAKVAGLEWIFVANAASSLFALAMLAGIKIRPTSVIDRSRLLAQVRDGVRVAVRNRQVRTVLIIGLAVWLSFGSFIALEPLFYREVLHSGPALLGWVLTVFGSGLFAGAWLSRKLPGKIISLRVLALLASLIGIGEIAYTATSHLAFVFGGNVIWGLSFGAIAPVARTIVHATTPQTHVGRVMGTMNVTQRIGTLLPLAFVGALGASIGVQRVLVGAGVVMVAFGLAIFPGASAADRERGAEIAAPTSAPPSPAYRGLP